MKFAAIDIGTNSIRLLIAEYQDGSLDKLVNELRVPRLGEGLNNGRINLKAQKRAIKVLKEYRELIEQYQADYRAVATSAIRDADNKDEFLKRVKEESGIKIDVIEGLEEARLSYLGIVKGVEKNEDNMLAIDIGGGSTEFIFGTVSGVTEYNSINLGAVRLKESHGENIEAMQDEAKEKIKAVLAVKEPQILLGVGGTITTLAAIEQELDTYQPQKIQNYELDLKTINEIFDYLAGLSLQERKKVVGLQEQRADIIIAGIVIVIAIMEYCSLRKLIVSDFGILEGIIYNNLNNGLNGSI
ncbi:MAG: Ppx/GppA phosphatase family protein [Bacillota bacterium]